MTTDNRKEVEENDLWNVKLSTREELVSFSTLSKDIINKIVKEGKYYNPAWTHYGKESTIYCDNCRSTTKTCIGLGEYDLCLKCANQK